MRKVSNRIVEAFPRFSRKQVSSLWIILIGVAFEGRKIAQQILFVDAKRLYTF